MESEFYTLAAVAEEVEYLKELLFDLPPFRERMPDIAISCNNQAVVTTTDNDLYNGWKRTMRIYHVYVFDLLKNDVIMVIDVRSQKNLVDPFTKDLMREFVEKTSKRIGLMSTL